MASFFARLFCNTEVLVCSCTLLHHWCGLHLSVNITRCACRGFGETGTGSGLGGVRHGVK